MEQGKQICETLKAIRRDIAEANGIDYSPAECTHKGDCAGTCPKCEQETRWLERQLRNRQALGKAVTIAGLSVALGAMSSCHPKIFQPDGMIMPIPEPTQTNLVNNVKNDSINTTIVTENDSTENIDMRLMGDVVMPIPSSDNPEQQKNTTKKKSTTKKSSKK